MTICHPSDLQLLLCLSFDFPFSLPASLLLLLFTLSHNPGPLQTSFIPLSYISAPSQSGGIPLGSLFLYMFLWRFRILYGGSEVYKFMNFQICKNDCKWHLWKNITGTHFYYLQGSRNTSISYYLFWPSSDL